VKPRYYDIAIGAAPKGQWGKFPGAHSTARAKVSSILPRLQILSGINS